MDGRQRQDCPEGWIYSSRKPLRLISPPLSDPLAELKADCEFPQHHGLHFPSCTLNWEQYQLQ
jgi:hypothetical protein